MKLRLVPAAITPVSPLEVVASLFTNQSYLNNFRQWFTNYFEGQNTYTFTSLMRATYFCLKTIKSISPHKNEIILPRYSCPSFLHGSLAANLKVVYCDINPKTLNIDLDSLKKAISSRTLAIIITNLFGLTNKIDDIITICKSANVIVIEGADYALGSIYKNRPVGSFADFTILNFQEGKAVPIGGAAVIERKTNYMEKYDDQKRQQSAFKPFFTLLAFSIFSKPFFYSLIINTLSWLKIDRKQLSMEDTIRSTSHENDYHPPSGNLASISKFQAKLGLKILEKMPGQQKTRLHNAKKISRMIDSNCQLSTINPTKNTNYLHYIRYPVLVKNENADEVCRLFNQNGIEASRMYIEHGMNIDPIKFPGAYYVANHIITLPCHSYLNTNDFKTYKLIIKSLHVSRLPKSF